MSSGTSNSDEYSVSTSNEEQYVPNDAMSLASADPYPLHYIHPLPNNNIQFMDSIKEDKILKTPKGDVNSDNDTPNGDEYITPQKENILQNAMLKKEEFFKCLQDEIYIETNNFHTEGIYGTIISFMGRHDRWSNCRLVCKLWNQLVYNKYWIYTEHMTMEQANSLKPGT